MNRGMCSHKSVLGLLELKQSLQVWVLMRIPGSSPKFLSNTIATAKCVCAHMCGHARTSECYQYKCASECILCAHTDARERF